MFAADDMQPYYKRNAVIRGRQQCVLTYPDFLNGYIGGDFIHVCNTEILRRHPFDEQLRTYEGVFFLMFYRDVKEMLFINEIVTIRERNRNDSVSRDFLRTDKIVIERNIRYGQLLLEDFGSEMEKLGMERRLSATKTNLLDNLLLLGRYCEAKDVLTALKPLHGQKAKNLWLVYALRLGKVYRKALGVYLFIKYKLLNHTISSTR